MNERRKKLLYLVISNMRKLNNQLNKIIRRLKKSAFPKRHYFVITLIVSFLLVLEVWNLWKILVYRSYSTISPPTGLLIFWVPIALFLFLHAVFTSMRSEKVVSILLFLFQVILICKMAIKSDILFYYLGLVNNLLVFISLIIILCVIISRKLKTSSSHN